MLSTDDKKVIFFRYGIYKNFSSLEENINRSLYSLADTATGQVARESSRPKLCPPKPESC